MWRPSAACRRVAQSMDGCVIIGFDSNLIPEYECENQRRPVPIVHYAAVAISPTTLIMGSSHGRNSQNDAEQAALQLCRSNGGKDCVGLYTAGTDFQRRLRRPVHPVPLVPGRRPIVPEPPRSRLINANSVAAKGAPSE